MICDSFPAHCAVCIAWLDVAASPNTKSEDSKRILVIDQDPPTR
jgi:hypothetical protein